MRKGLRNRAKKKNLSFLKRNGPQEKASPRNLPRLYFMGKTSFKNGYYLNHNVQLQYSNPQRYHSIIWPRWSVMEALSCYSVQSQPVPQTILLPSVRLIVLWVVIVLSLWASPLIERWWISLLSKQWSLWQGVYQFVVFVDRRYLWLFF